MAATKTKLYAVLTGDIVKSSRLPEGGLDDARAAVLEAAGLAGKWKRGLVRGTPEFFRGDAWQLLLTDPARALRVAVLIRGWLAAEELGDTRVSVAVGSVESVARKISLSTGDAFVRSGHGLDEMPAVVRLAVAGPAGSGALGEWLPVVAELVDAHVIGWTARQAEIVTHAIDPSDPTHEEIAQSLDPAVSQQTVTQALRGANWHAVRAAIQRFEATKWAEFGTK